MRSAASFSATAISREPNSNCRLADEIARGGPWGQGFPEPLFHGDFDVVNQRVVGERHLKLSLRKNARVVDAIAFNQAPLRKSASARRSLIGCRATTSAIARRCSSSSSTSSRCDRDRIARLFSRRDASMAELTSLREQLKDLRARNDALRGYL